MYRPKTVFAGGVNPFKYITDLPLISTDYVLAADNLSEKIRRLLAVNTVAHVDQLAAALEVSTNTIVSSCAKLLERGYIERIYEGIRCYRLTKSYIERMNYETTAE